MRRQGALPRAPFEQKGDDLRAAAFFCVLLPTLFDLYNVGMTNRNSKRSMSWLFLSVTLVFMFAGLALSFWSASKALESRRIAAEGVPATAQIVRVEEEERHINRDDGPRIQIVYFEVAGFTSADGRKIETRLWPKYDAKLVLKPGDKIEILYNFDNPEQVVEAGGKREFQQGVIGAVFGFLVSVVAAFLAFRSLPSILSGG